MSVSKDVAWLDGPTPDVWTPNARDAGLRRVELGIRAAAHANPPLLGMSWWGRLAEAAWG